MSYLGNKPAEVPLTSADLADSIVTSAKIADDTIVNVDVNNISATKITAGTVATARLGSGTASSSTVLYGDQTYKAEPTGVSLTGSTNNTIPTVTGANALTGEANLTFNAATDPPVLLLEASRLEIKHTGDFGLYSTFNTNRGAAGDSLGELLWQWNGTAVAKIQARAGVDTTNKDDGSMAFYTTTSGGSITERMRITSEGVVGMGAVLDGDLGVGLHIKTSDTGADVHSSADELVIERNGDGGMTFLNSTSGESFINFGDSGDNDIGQMSYHHSSNHMAFKTNASERMRINSAGIVSIGTTETAYGNLLSAGSNGIILTDTSGSIIATDTGNLTLARTNADNNNRDILNFNRNGSTCGQITGTNSSTTYATSSDYRLKENEISITDGIDRIKQLKPYKFNFKVDADKTVDGFFAHEVSSIVPEAIIGEKDAMHPEVLYDEEILYTAEDELPEGKEVGDVKHLIGDVKEETKINAQGIDQSKLVPLLVASLQEAITKIETLETANTDLTTRLEALENA